MAISDLVFGLPRVPESTLDIRDKTLGSDGLPTFPVRSDVKVGVDSGVIFEPFR